MAGIARLPISTPEPPAKLDWSGLTQLADALAQRNDSQNMAGELSRLASYDVGPEATPTAQRFGVSIPQGGTEGTGKGSWYSQFKGAYDWRDAGDRPNSNALGVPDANQGIALPSRATLGQWFDVTAPDGKKYRLQQTDVGPAKWTGRGIDISAAAADRMGYSPRNFPTDAGFSWSLVK